MKPAFFRKGGAGGKETDRRKDRPPKRCAREAPSFLPGIVVEEGGEKGPYATKNPLRRSEGTSFFSSFPLFFLPKKIAGKKGMASFFLESPFFLPVFDGGRGMMGGPGLSFSLADRFFPLFHAAVGGA